MSVGFPWMIFARQYYCRFNSRRIVMPLPKPSLPNPSMKRFGHTLPNSSTVAISLGILLLLLAALPQRSNAQDDDRRNERDMRRAAERERWQRDFNVADYLKRIDDNGDGILRPEEISSDRTRRYLDRMGISVNRPSSIKDLAARYKADQNAKDEQKRKEFANNLPTNVQNFGIAVEQLGVEEFGIEREATQPLTFDEASSGLKESDVSEDAKRKADKLLKTFDRNENGMLDGDEISRMSWTSPPPQESDRNRDGRLSRLELAARINDAEVAKSEKRANKERSSESRPESGRDGKSEDRRRDDSDRRSSDYRSRRRDRGRESSATTTRSRSTSSQHSSNSAPKDKTAAYASYVDGIFRKYDVDKDGKLAKDELAKMSRPFKGDQNNDGYMDRDEVMNVVSGGKPKSSKSRRSGRSSSNTPGMSQTAGSAGSNASRGGRLSGSLASRDADGDGKIQMHEYTNQWNETTLKEFRQSDTNGDGMLDGEELKAAR